MMTERDLAIIQGVELAMDWNLPVPEEQIKKYYDLIERRSDQIEMQSIGR